MKILFASDIHGDAVCAKATLDVFDREKAEKLILLGDLLYHGPRNDLPEHYAPKEVIRLLNDRRENLCCVRGNCDGEVDQMVLNFPILSDSLLIWDHGHCFFITHGHHHNIQTPPPLGKGDILIHGHTHVPAVTPFGCQNIYINPGSVTLPKENFPRSYMLYENGRFSIRDFDGNEFLHYTL